ncbi:hypothetical protein ScPMuIL_001613 [Solemya velum]
MPMGVATARQSNCSKRSSTAHFGNESLVTLDTTGTRITTFLSGQYPDMSVVMGPLHSGYKFLLIQVVMLSSYVLSQPIQLPLFSKLKSNYPGYRHHGGMFDNHHIVRLIGCNNEVLLHDTSALRLSYALNKVGDRHSLGRDLIRLSKFGHDSVQGKGGFQFIYQPIAFGPYMADKYGFPKISKLHQVDPLETKKYFWGKQGILRVITYTKIGNLPKGHVALWDCDHFHQSQDWIANHSLITVEFWESPDSSCPSTAPESPVDIKRLNITTTMKKSEVKDLHTLLKNRSFKRKFIKKYYLENGQSRHHRHHHEKEE